ncbi:MAG: molybdenum cofactor biosynthesis protein MoaE [Desulfurococcaceae archaeon]
MLVEARLVREDPAGLIQRVLEVARSSATESEVGAMALFLGLVKGSVDGREVLSLDYDAYEEVAEGVLRSIAEETAKRHGLEAIFIYHRVGSLAPGEPTLLVAAVGRSREDVLGAVSEALERVKREAPIFKLERREDGDYWVLRDDVRVRRAGTSPS